MKRHANLSIFVPHVGCPNQCVFCNQRRISGAISAPTADEVTRLCDEFLPQKGEGNGTEIAFFGGSFTAIDREYMTALLAAAYPFVEAKRAVGIRISTRPDAIDDEILTILRRYGVSAIELGAQSMDDEILRLNKRGHKASDVEAASERIKSFGGFSLGLQMMEGMYGDKNPKKTAKETAAEFIRLKPLTVRIYPTIVVEDTELYDLYKAGKYKPLSVDEAAAITAELLMDFESAEINVIRVGLHADESITKSAAAGPFHPAFGEICYSLVMRKKIEEAIKKYNGDKSKITVVINRRDLSKTQGHRKSNLAYFSEKGIALKVEIDEKMSEGEIRLT